MRTTYDIRNKTIEFHGTYDEIDRLKKSGRLLWGDVSTVTGKVVRTYWLERPIVCRKDEVSVCLATPDEFHVDDNGATLLVSRLNCYTPAN